MAMWGERVPLVSLLSVLAAGRNASKTTLTDSAADRWQRQNLGPAPGQSNQSQTQNGQANRLVPQEYLKFLR